MINSMRQLATALGLSQTATARHLKHPDWPYGPPPYQERIVPAIRAWIAKNRPADNAEADPTESGGQKAASASAKEIKTKVETSILMIDLAEKAGRLHGVEECRNRMTQRILSAKNRLMRLEQSIPTAVGAVGEEAVRMASVIRAEVEAALNDLAGN